MSCRLGPRGRRRSDLNGQQNRTVSPARFRSSRLPSPCEEQALRNAVSPRHLAHHGPRHQRLFHDPRLLVLAPTPSALDPQNLPIHLCMTLRLAQRSHPSRRTPSQQGGRRRTDTIKEPALREKLICLAEDLAKASSNCWDSTGRGEPQTRVPWFRHSCRPQLRIRRIRRPSCYRRRESRL